jgi:hypothetical protein
MREHQIVITLKPDQFLEVQRQARAANAKSMGIFVRQKLLAALGIEGAAIGEAPIVGGQNVEASLLQIRRLHGELKTFVAESLSLYNLEETVNASAVSSPAQTESLPSVGTDVLEGVAAKAFAISPRLGPIGESTPVQPARAGMPVAHASAEADVQPNPTVYNEPHKRDQHRYAHPHAASDLMDVPFRGNAETLKPNAVINDPLESLLPNEDEFKPSAQQMDAGQTSSQAIMPPSTGTFGQAAPTGSQPVGGTSSLYFEGEQPPIEETPPATAAVLETPAPSPEPEAPAQQSEKKTDGTKPSAPRSLDYPSLSGSPPPKRRQV